MEAQRWSGAVRAPLERQGLNLCFLPVITFSYEPAPGKLSSKLRLILLEQKATEVTAITQTTWKRVDVPSPAKEWRD